MNTTTSANDFNINRAVSQEYRHLYKDDTYTKSI